MYDNNNINYDVQSLTFKDVSTMRYVWLGLGIGMTKYLHKNRHTTWAIVFGLLSLGTVGSIIEDIIKPGELPAIK